MSAVWIILGLLLCCIVMLGDLHGWFDFECPDEETPMGYESAQPEQKDEKP